MNGQPMRATGTRPALARGRRRARPTPTPAATVHYRSTGVFFWTLRGRLGGGGPAGHAACSVASRGVRPGPGRAGRRLLPDGGASPPRALPVATYLAGLVPWERVRLARCGARRGARRWPTSWSPAVAAARALAAAPARPGPRRPGRHPGHPRSPTSSPARPWSSNGLLGYDAIVAGRFTGYGNLTFGAHVGQRAAASPPRWPPRAGRRAGPARARLATRRHRAGARASSSSASSARRAWAATSAGCWPRCPGSCVLAMLLARVRVTVVRLLAVLAAAVVAVGDGRRPRLAAAAGRPRSHLGRFVEQMLDRRGVDGGQPQGPGQPGILLRQPARLDAAGRARRGRLAGAPRRAAAQRPGDRAGGPAGLSAEQVFVVRSVLLSALLSLVIGAAVNDSGVALPATAAAAAGAADGLAGRRGRPRGTGSGDDGGWRSPLRAG